MSEAVSAGIGAAAAGTSTTAGSSNANGTQGSSQKSASTSQGFHAGANSQGDKANATQAGAKNTETTQDPTQSTQEELEELKLGNVRAKVPKEVAKAIKDLERGFQSKAQKAAQAEKMLKLAQENPKEFYRQTGKDPYAFAEEWLAEKYEQMTMPPEQKKLLEMEQKLNKYEAVEKQSKQQLVEKLKQFGDYIPENIEQYSKEEIAEYVEHRSQQYQREAQNLDHEIGKAFSDSQIPADKYTIAKVAFEIASAARQGKSLSAKEALDKVTKGYYDGTREHFSKMDGKRIHELLGEDVLDKIRKYDLEKVTEKDAFKIGQQNGQGANSSSQNDKPKKVYNETEWRKVMGLR